MQEYQGIPPGGTSPEEKTYAGGGLTNDTQGKREGGVVI